MNRQARTNRVGTVIVKANEIQQYNRISLYGGLYEVIEISETGSGMICLHLNQPRPNGKDFALFNPNSEVKKVIITTS